MESCGVPWVALLSCKGVINNIYGRKKQKQRERAREREKGDQQQITIMMINIFDQIFWLKPFRVQYFVKYGLFFPTYLLIPDENQHSMHNRNRIGKKYWHNTFNIFTALHQHTVAYSFSIIKNNFKKNHTFSICIFRNYDRWLLWSWIKPLLIQYSGL